MSEQLIQTPCAFGDNGNFLLERELGSGGMGGVYLGRDKMLDRPVAVKVMLKEFGADPEFVEKFKREAQSAAKLIHPNIAQIYSYGICDGMPYIAMELAAGGSLYSIMNANPGKTDVARVIKICQQVAQALQCASDQGFVHGDVKPENILLDANGNAKLVDFGLAAMQKDTDEIWGTPYYISPEKVKKEKIDFRADMYSLGGTLYHALTGVAPFEGTDSIAVVKKRFEVLPKKPSEVRPELSPAIDNLVMKMLALDKEQRYPSFESLLEAFKSVLTTGLSAKPSSAAPSTAKTAARTRRTTMRARRMTTMKRPGTTIKTEPVETSASDDEENGGSLGLKVFGIIVGVILLIAGVIGGLVWYQVADKNSRAADERAQIVSGIEKARAAVTETIEKAAKFADEYDELAARAIDECQKQTDELKKMIPADEGELLKPGPTQELLDAIASTNEVSAIATTNTVEATTNAVPVAVTNAPPADAEEPTEKQKEFSELTLTMNELWERAYGCQACAIRIRHSVRKLIAKGAEAEELKDETRENMEKLAGHSRDLVEMFDRIKTSKDVETVRKGITFIKSRGEKTVEQTVKRLRIKKIQDQRKKDDEERRKAEEERKRKAEEAKKAKIEEETAAAKAKFDAVVAQGCIRQLNWTGALRQLEAAKSEMATVEGQFAFDREIRKVNDMKKVQDIFVKNLEGHVFRGKLNKCKVISVNETEMSLMKADGKTKAKISWQKFYKDYPGNFNEIINAYIFNARNTSARVKLTLREWADAMTGAALTMQLVCAEVNGAIERSKKLMQETVKGFPEYQKTAQEIFPDMKFEDETEE